MTKGKSPTRSATNAHEGQTAADTNQLKKFEVELHWTQHNTATVIVEASSHAEAEEMADEIQSDEVDDWNPVDGDLSVESVELVDGGDRHE
jgi:hypothetical protein